MSALARNDFPSAGYRHDGRKPKSGAGAEDDPYAILPESSVADELILRSTEVRKAPGGGREVVDHEQLLEVEILTALAD
jgi:hypothetical protein